ncbi:Rossmann-like and DUF2520 domain-containing protein [Novosphingobium guangzhouense]|uniref:Cytoplasmic protein n=1 Tax=Novosphingobium guangzhouense TaxID=1850347 RepID=A0A2K2G6R2_9SPHN|nr:DUF2520 domain-containing protein [Novosphingobium guangzhouense]PNU06727.1 cytoplasmic protein [Novosphingobium guangzhouense]
MNSLPIAKRIGIVGTGRVARAFALALRGRSAAPIMLWGRSPQRVAQVSGEVAQCTAADTLNMLTAACDLIVIAIADGAIAGIVAAMKQAPPKPGAFVCHVSGGSGIAPLVDLQSTEVLTAAVHPAMTFTGNPAFEVSRMAEACFAVTASSDRAMAISLALVDALGGKAVEVTEDHRPLYHAALCHAANHLVTLVAGASQALTAAGVTDPGTFLAPLVRAALENTLEQGIAALSGPVLRGDADTIRSHLHAIAHDVPSLMAPYKAMAQATLHGLGEVPGQRREELKSLLD